MSYVRCQVSGVTCCVSSVKSNLSGVMCHVSSITCHLSITPTATVRDPAPANSPIMHSRLVCLPKTKKLTKKTKQNLNVNTSSKRQKPENF